MMRAKMTVASVTKPYDGAESIVMHPVCGKLGPNGENEDNTFARYSPSGRLELTVTNPDLVGKIKEGQTFYVDFTEHIA